MSTQTATVLPANFVELNGQVLHLQDQYLHAIPGDSTLTVTTPDGTVVTHDLNGLSAEDIDAAVRSLPKNLHGDTSPAIPGRMRNLMKAAIEDGWIVRAVAQRKYVQVQFHLPNRFVVEALSDLVADVDPNRGVHYSSYMVRGYVSYDWDVDAQAMRIDAIHQYNLILSREVIDTDDPDHRSVHVARVHSSHDEDPLKWRDFVATVHDHCPPVMLQRIEAARQARAAKSQADEAFDLDAAIPSRANLREQLRALRSQAERRIVALEGAAKPDLTPTGLKGFADRLRSAQADRELHTAIVQIFDAEGTWEGNRRLHIDEVFVKALRTRLSTLTTAPLRTLATADELHVLAYTADKLSTLAKVQTTIEVVV
jgi:hypothetical protein